MHFRTEEIPERIDTSGEDEREAALATVAALARPRLAGSAGARETERELRARFEALGYEVRELGFRFSTWPGRFGVPLIGALLVAGTVVATTLLLADRAASGLLALLLTAAVIAACVAVGRGALARLPWGRVETANWLVQRPGARPRYLVAAHRDSKSQPVSIFLRAAAIATGGAGWVLLVALAAVAATIPVWRSPPLIVAAAVLTAAAGAVLVTCRAENESPGALDNATGLAALLALARRERDRDDVAFLVTDGEELGLAGAWAVGPRLPRVAGIINLDGLDDEGDFHVVERYGWPRRGLAPHLAAALLSAADGLGLDAERRDLPVGLLLDHVAFVEAQIPAVTLMRGTTRSLRRVHRPDDGVDRLSGEGVVAAAALVAAALRLLGDGR